MTGGADELFRLIGSLWKGPFDHGVEIIVPRCADSLASFYDNLRALVARLRHDGRHQPAIDPAAVVRGEIICTGPDCVIEAGVVVHESCRLVLGPRCRVRSGAVLRDEVVLGPDCLVGVHCEVFRSVLLGPQTLLGHFVLMADSIIGRDVSVAGNVVFASSMVKKGQTVPLRHGGESFDSRRSHLGALVGDGVRFGASTTLCPGAIVTPGLTLPPQVVLLGTVDERRRAALMERFFEAWDI